MFEKRKETVEPAPEPQRVEPDNRVFKNEPVSRATATIGKTICIEGNISGTENLIINGEVKGSVNLADHDLTIGETGKVAADLTGKSVRIDGEVNGDIAGAEVVVVSKSGQVRGNIVAPRVTLEDGANFKGSIDMDPVRKDSKPSSAAGPNKASAHQADAETAGSAA